MKILIPFALLAAALGFASRSDAQVPAPAQPAAPAAATPAGPPPPETRGRYALPDEPACCDAMGGPEEGFDTSAIDAEGAEAADAARWRLPDDRRDALRLTPPAPRPLNRLTIRF